MVSFIKRVPQGSVLGPLLYNLYINDLFYIIKTNICNFADDTTPYTADICLKGLMEKLQCATKSAMEWFHHNGMKLNFSKCNLLVCGHKYESMILIIHNTIVIKTNLVKLLGIKIEPELTFNKYMEMVCKKASQKHNALSRLCTFIPFHKRKLLMNAFVESQFSYSPLVWMFHSRQVNSKVNSLHYRALRMVYFDKTSSFEELLIKDGSVTIHHRNLQVLAVEMFKVIKGIAPTFMNEIFSRNGNAFADNVSSNTRSKSIFYNPSNPKTVYHGLETLKCLGPKIWDMVPIHIKNSISLSAFKAKIKRWTPTVVLANSVNYMSPKLFFL